MLCSRRYIARSDSTAKQTNLTPTKKEFKQKESLSACTERIR